MSFRAWNPVAKSAALPYKANTAATGPPCTVLASQLTFSSAGGLGSASWQLVEEKPGGSIVISLAVVSCGRRGGVDRRAENSRAAKCGNRD